MTKFLMVFVTLVALYQAGASFGGMVKDADGNSYVSVSWCTMHLNEDNTEVTGKDGTVNGRCYLPLDGGKADDYDIWKSAEVTRGNRTK